MKSGFGAGWVSVENGVQATSGPNFFFDLFQRLHIWIVDTRSVVHDVLGFSSIDFPTDLGAFFVVFCLI